MTTAEQRLPGPRRSHAETHLHEGAIGWLTTTDHKKIGVLYMVSAFVFFLFAGLLSLVMRAEFWAVGMIAFPRRRLERTFGRGKLAFGCCDAGAGQRIAERSTFERPVEGQEHPTAFDECGPLRRLLGRK